MKIGRFKNRGKEHYGIIQHDRIYCLDVLAKRTKTNLPSKMASFISHQPAQETV